MSQQNLVSQLRSATSTGRKMPVLGRSDTEYSDHESIYSAKSAYGALAGNYSYNENYNYAYQSTESLGVDQQTPAVVVGLSNTSYNDNLNNNSVRRGDRRKGAALPILPPAPAPTISVYQFQTPAVVQPSTLDLYSNKENIVPAALSSYGPTTAKSSVLVEATEEEEFEDDYYGYGMGSMTQYDDLLIPTPPKKTKKLPPIVASVAVTTAAPVSTSSGTGMSIFSSLFGTKPAVTTTAAVTTSVSTPLVSSVSNSYSLYGDTSASSYYGANSFTYGAVPTTTTTSSYLYGDYGNSKTTTVGPLSSSQLYGDYGSLKTTTEGPLTSSQLYGDYGSVTTTAAPLYDEDSSFFSLPSVTTTTSAPFTSSLSTTTKTSSLYDSSSLGLMDRISGLTGTTPAKPLDDYLSSKTIDPIPSSYGGTFSVDPVTSSSSAALLGYGAMTDLIEPESSATILTSTLTNTSTFDYSAPDPIASTLGYSTAPSLLPSTSLLSSLPATTKYGDLYDEMIIPEEEEDEIEEYHEDFEEDVIKELMANKSLPPVPDYTSGLYTDYSSPAKTSAVTSSLYTSSATPTYYESSSGGLGYYPGATSTLSKLSTIPEQVNDNSFSSLNELHNNYGDETAPSELLGDVSSAAPIVADYDYTDNENDYIACGDLKDTNLYGDYQPISTMNNNYLGSGMGAVTTTAAQNQRSVTVSSPMTSTMLNQQQMGNNSLYTKANSTAPFTTAPTTKPADPPKKSLFGSLFNDGLNIVGGAVSNIKDKAGTLVVAAAAATAGVTASAGQSATHPTTTSSTMQPPHTTSMVTNPMATSAVNSYGE